MTGLDLPRSSSSSAGSTNRTPLGTSGDGERPALDGEAGRDAARVLEAALDLALAKAEAGGETGRERALWPYTGGEAGRERARCPYVGGEAGRWYALGEGGRR